MKLNHKYKAFTLTETVFGLIISSVLIGVIYTVFTSFNKQFVLFQQQQLTMNDYMVFDATFNKDIYAAVNIHYTDASLLLKQYDETVITYNFKDNTIERLHNEVSEILFSKLVSYTIQKKEDHSIISLKLLLHDTPILLNYYKKNKLDQIINTVFINETRSQ